MTQPPQKSVSLGIAAAIAASVIGSAWQIASRHAVTTTLDPIALAVLRYCVPTLLLLPVLLRIGLFPPGLSKRRLAVLVAGGGLPFVLVGLTGARFAPVAHMGVLLASVMPVFTALLMWVFYRDAVATPRMLGFSLIAVGVAVLGERALSTMDSTTLIGDLLFLLAAALWAAYSVAFRSAGLSPWQGVAVVNAWSALLVIPLYAVVGSGSLASAPMEDLLLQTLMQGVVAGLLGLAIYSVAIRQLGPAPASAFAALVPVLSAVGGAVLLSESLTPWTSAAAVLAATGVLLASGLFRLPRRKSEVSYLHPVSSTTSKNADVEQAGRDDAGEA
jgi:drug/metabolite transporter (DMT)-like permease